MTQPESRLSRDIMQAIRSYPDTFCFKVHGSEHMMAGLPDIIACVRGNFVGIETKMPGKELNTSKRQEYVHGLIKLAGGDAFVVSSVSEVKRLIEQLINRPLSRS